jgi:UDP-4-amino-4,6-dideoxy-N-acetyl-beta-L-altrosamine transaminase
MTKEYKRLPYGRQFIEADDIDAVSEVLRSDYLTTGPAVDRFEHDLAAYVEVPFVVVCSNGTTALHLAACAIGLQPGDIVIVPTLTFLATANAGRYCGAEVVFADVDPESGLMTYKTFLEALTRCHKKPKAVFPVHLNGQNVDMREIYQYCREQGIYIIEDACHALGGRQPMRENQSRSVPDGSCEWADMTVFSFHPVKSIATGEGGAVTTRSEKLANKMRQLRNHGMTRQPEEFANKDLAFDEEGNANSWYYELSELGFNYRLSDLNCALGISQLKKLPDFIEKRRLLANEYVRLIGDGIPGARIRPVKFSEFGESGWHLFPVLIDFERIGISRNQLFHLMRERNIYLQVHYIPVHMQPYYRDEDLVLRGAMTYYSKVVSLPLFVSMDIGDVQTVVDSLRELTNP